MTTSPQYTPKSFRTSDRRNDRGERFGRPARSGRGNRNDEYHGTEPYDRNPSDSPYRSLVIDGIVYTFHERTSQIYSEHDAVCIAAMCARERRMQLPEAYSKSSFDKRVTLTTVELNRRVEAILDTVRYQR